MSVSARFKQLRTRLAELREHLLPKSFSLTGDYTDRELDRARGYRFANSTPKCNTRQIRQPVVVHQTRSGVA